MVRGGNSHCSSEVTHLKGKLYERPGVAKQRAQTQCPGMKRDQSQAAQLPRHESLLGAQLEAEGVRFRVWAPAAQAVAVTLEHPGGMPSTPTPLAPEGNGYFSAFLPCLTAGALYRFKLDEQQPHPDPCSRYQPRGPHGPSMVTDPNTHRWMDALWPGIELHGQVIYEMHIGAFTPEGTFDAANAQLPELQRLGVTVLEIMPLHECPGRWNWGYDGVNLYAPYHVYGESDAFKRFVDAAHALGMAVILDVVYNHLGPDGNYLACFSPDYFTDRYSTDWGEAINFDGPNSGPVREFFIRNACYWVEEFHLDGLRLDATQSIHDSSPRHVLGELSQRVRKVAHPRRIILIAENEPQDVRTIEPVERGGHGLDAIWNDDYHHSARVALTGRPDGYYHDHRGRAQEFISAIRHGFLFQGQYYRWQKQPRGTPALHHPSPGFVHFIQNHDQIGNTFYGQRLSELSSPGRLRAMTALTLLGPQTPMLFMGQEFGATTPFAFFADHKPELAIKVWQGRRQFMSQFKPFATAEAQQAILDPAAEETFLRSKLDFSERRKNQHAYDLHRDLLELRHDDPVIALQDRELIDGAVLSEQSFVLRWFGGPQGDRLLVVNLGTELDFRPAPEPLLAPSPGTSWRVSWSSDQPKYGGPGISHPCQADGWLIPGESATLLWAAPVLPTQEQVGASA